MFSDQLFAKLRFDAFTGSFADVRYLGKDNALKHTLKTIPLHRDGMNKLPLYERLSIGDHFRRVDSSFDGEVWCEQPAFVISRTCDEVEKKGVQLLSTQTPLEQMLHQLMVSIREAHRPLTFARITPPHPTGPPLGSCSAKQGLYTAVYALQYGNFKREVLSLTYKVYSGLDAATWQTIYVTYFKEDETRGPTLMHSRQGWQPRKQAR